MEWCISLKSYCSTPNCYLLYARVPQPFQLYGPAQGEGGDGSARAAGKRALARSSICTSGTHEYLLTQMERACMRSPVHARENACVLGHYFRRPSFEQLTAWELGTPVLCAILLIFPSEVEDRK